jgi:hypothetical protein
MLLHAVQMAAPVLEIMDTPSYGQLNVIMYSISNVWITASYITESCLDRVEFVCVM